MPWHSPGENLRPLMKVNTPRQWILVTARRRIILSDCSVLSAFLFLFFFIFFITIVQSTELSQLSRLVVRVVEADSAKHHLRSASAFLCYRVGMNLFDGVLIDSHETVDATKRNVNLTGGVAVGRVVTTVHSAPGTQRFSVLNSWLPPFLSYEKKRTKQSVNFHALPFFVFNYI